jgi:hypothetical protein
MIPGDPRLVTIGQPFDQVSKKAIGIPAQTHRRGATPQPPVGSRQAEDTMADAVTIKEMETVTLSPEELKTMDAYWRAANYLSVGQIYLLDNPLLEKPLTIEDVTQVARALGNNTGAQLHLRASEPSDQTRQPEHDLPDRSGSRWTGAGGQYLSGG